MIKMKIKWFISIIILLLCSGSLIAQNTMRVHYKDGSMQDISITEVDSVTFVTKDAPDNEVSLVGDWLWGNKNAGYYELITFNEDHTYTGYDNYFSFGFDTWTYGWYSQFGSMLTLQSNGFGYKRMYNWHLIGLSYNALEVMTNTGGYTYYRLQSEVVNVSLASPFLFADDDYVVFADEVIVKAQYNKLTGNSKGITYILVNIASLNEIVAYKVIVE